MKKYFYRFCAQLLGPRAVARILFYFQLRRGISSVLPNVLVNSRSVFSKDIAKMKGSNNLCYLIISNSLLASIQSAWIPRYAQIQSFYYNRLSSKSKEWLKCKVFATTLLESIVKHGHLIGVLSANFDYWQDAAFRVVCSETDIAFMVLRRENEATEKARDKSIKRYRDVRIGRIDLAMVFSESSRQLLNAIQSKDIMFKDIIITGPPRLDRQIPPSKSIRLLEKDSIVVFSYINGNYCDDPRNFWVVVQYLYGFSQKNQIPFIMKCKSKGDMQNLYEAFPLHKMNPEKIEWWVSQTPIETVQRALVTVSFNSTVIYQLLSMSVPVMIPFVYTSEQEKTDAILHDAKGAEAAGIFRVDTMEEFQYTLKYIVFDKISFDYEHRERVKLREQYLSWDPMNPSAVRVEKAILSLANRV